MAKVRGIVNRDPPVLERVPEDREFFLVSTHRELGPAWDRARHLEGAIIGPAGSRYGVYVPED